jgi:hypothetical protein
VVSTIQLIKSDKDTFVLAFMLGNIHYLFMITGRLISKAALTRSAAITILTPILERRSRRSQPASR